MLYAIIMGGLYGWIAGNIMGLRGSVWKNIIIGVAGSAVGSFLLGLVGFYAGGMLANMIVGVGGACVLLAIINRLS